MAEQEKQFEDNRLYNLIEIIVDGLEYRYNSYDLNNVPEIIGACKMVRPNTVQAKLNLLKAEEQDKNK